MKFSAQQLYTAVKAAFVVCIASFVVAACDATTGPDATSPSSELVLAYSGSIPIMHTTIGDATLVPRSEGGVTLRSESGTGGVRLDLDDSPASDVYFLSEGTTTGASFSTELIGTSREGGDQSLVRLDHTRQSSGQYHLSTHLGQFDVDNAFVEFRNDETVLHTSSLSGSRDGGTVGMTNDEPTSYHYSRVETESGEIVVVVSVDYEVESTEPGYSLSGETDAWPKGSDGSPISVTHVSLVLEGASLRADQIDGVAVSGTSRLSILDASLGRTIK